MLVRRVREAVNLRSAIHARADQSQPSAEIQAVSRSRPSVAASAAFLPLCELHSRTAAFLPPNATKQLVCLAASCHIPDYVTSDIIFPENFLAWMAHDRSVVQNMSQRSLSDKPVLSRSADWEIAAQSNARRRLQQTRVRQDEREVVRPSGLPGLCRTKARFVSKLPSGTSKANATAQNTAIEGFARPDSSVCTYRGSSSAASARRSCVHPFAIRW